MTEQVEGLAKIIPHPGTKLYFTKCCICSIEGKFEAYSIRSESLAKAYFYCNDCKKHQEQGFSIDIKECPELAGANAIPRGVIIWDEKK